MVALEAERKRKMKRQKRRAYYFLFPVVFFYYELLFKIFAVGKVFASGTFFAFLFCICYGAIAYVLATLFKDKKINRIITLVFLILTAVIFLIELFVFQQFKIFYDVNTVVGGAGGAMTGFLGDIFKMIFSFGGFLKIILYAVPSVAYGLCGKKFMTAKQGNIVTRGFALILAIVIFLFDILFISVSDISAKYKEEYSFQDAVSNFGLMTGLRLDVKKAITGDDGGSFINVESDPGSTEPDDPSADPEPEIVYGDNVMNIDFAALASSTSNKKLKELDNYVNSLTPSKKNKYTGLFEGKNLIFITAEAFSAEVIDPELTPTLYRMATKGINFTDYYQPASAGTTGGEYQNIFGLLPSEGGKSFKNTASHNNYFTLGNQFNRLGYYGKAFHNNTYTFYDRHKTHINLGYSDGYMGYGNGMEEYVKKQWPQSDLEMLEGTLPTYIEKEHFNVYYMSVSGHSGYSRSGNSMTKKNWQYVENLPYSDDVKGYLAANIELDRAMEATIRILEAYGKANDTVICISADHFPYGLDNDAKLSDLKNLNELYGYTVKNNIQRDHNRLILWCGSLEEEEPIIVSEPTSSLDVLPTLSNLFALEYDSRLLPGRDVFSDAEAIVFNTGYDWKTTLGTYISSSGKFTPADDSVVIPDGYVDRIKAIVKNKIKYCASVLSTDYYDHVMG